MLSLHFAETALQQPFVFGQPAAGLLLNDFGGGQCPLGRRSVYVGDGAPDQAFADLSGLGNPLL